MARNARIRTRDGLARRLGKEPREVVIAIAARAALRVTPLWSDFFQSALSVHKAAAAHRAAAPMVVLLLFRCVGVSLLSAALRNRDLADLATRSASRVEAFDAAFAASAASAAAAAAAASAARAAAASAPLAARAAAASGPSAAAAAAGFASRARPVAYESVAIWQAISEDVTFAGSSKFFKFVNSPLWQPIRTEPRGGVSSRSTTARFWEDTYWRDLRQHLLADGAHWKVWTDWYEAVRDGREPWGLPHAAGNDALLQALTWPEEKWKREPAAINTELQALVDAARGKLELPDQRPAPILVEERDGKVAKVSDRDSPLAASERDFNQWREPVAAHIDELLSGDFKAGTNHSRVRDRLDSMRRNLEGGVADVKENQFKLGYDIDRFGGLLAAYETGGDDMPVLGADVLKDLRALDVGLRMGLSKLERWAEFREEAKRQASDPEGRGEQVAEAIETIAAEMEKQPRYFNPELPASFRWVAEAVKDPRGASKTTFFGAVRSLQNLFSFLGQRALGIGKAATDAVEKHIGKAVATTLVTLFADVALRLSGLVPEGLGWVVNLLKALGTVAL